MEFFVNGEPQGKARPRFSRRNGAVYTPTKTKNYEREIEAKFLAAGGKIIPADCYVCVRVDAFYSVPKSYSKRRRKECLDNICRPAKKPDIDNILKAVLDGLNGVAYEDDRQVVYIECRKRYTEYPEGYIRICVYETKE
nr:MAG TPA_asm: Endodeoxyribonuclease RusA [Caudoviricetes sp.]